MTQDGPGHVQAELPTEPSRRVVAELVRVPMRDLIARPGFLGRFVGLCDPVGDRLAV
jgi:hypothetical protein